MKEKPPILIIGSGEEHLSPLVRHIHNPEHNLLEHRVFLNTNHDDAHSIWKRNDFQKFKIERSDLRRLHQYGAIIVVGDYVLHPKTIEENDLTQRIDNIIGYHSSKQHIPIVCYNNHRDAISAIHRILKDK